MGYLALDFENGARAYYVTRSPQTDTHFSPREWQVIWLARTDGAQMPGQPSRLGRMIGLIFGNRPFNALADARLEVLRRAAAHLWHRGLALSSAQVEQLQAHGYSFRQIASLSSFVTKSRRKSR